MYFQDAQREILYIIGAKTVLSEYRFATSEKFLKNTLQGGGGFRAFPALLALLPDGRLQNGGCNARAILLFFPGELPVEAFLELSHGLFCLFCGLAFYQVAFYE